MSAASQLEELQERLNWHWRNSMRPIRFFALDARAVIPYLFWLVYLRLITIILATVVTLTFWAVERRGLTFPAALRALRTWILGPKRPALITLRRRRFADYG